MRPQKNPRESKNKREGQEANTDLFPGELIQMVKSYNHYRTHELLLQARIGELGLGMWVIFTRMYLKTTFEYAMINLVSGEH